MREHIQQLSSKKYWPLIDVFKLICALLVVLIHCLEILEGHPIASAIVHIFGGQAVPFFMIVSGFFLGSKLSKSEKPLSAAWKCAKDWLLLYAVWTILWMPYWISTYRGLYPEASWIYRVFLIVRRVLFAGQGVYWYLLALAEAAVILGLCVQYRKEKLLYGLGILGLILGFIYDLDLSAFSHWNQAVYSVFSWSNNFIMKGIPYLAMGYFVSTHMQKRPKVGVLWIVYGIMTLAMVGLYARWPQVRFAFYPVQALCLMLIAVWTKHVPINNQITHICRNLSTSFYYLHTIFIYGVIDILFGVDANILLRVALAILGSVLVYGFTVLVNWKPLKWLLGIR